MTPTPTFLVPHLICRDASAAIGFYEKAFGAVAANVLQLPDGHTLYAALKIDGAPVYLSEESPNHGVVGPLALGGSPVIVHLQVADCDAVFERAIEAGCTVVTPLQDMFWGDRYGMLADPYGHRWSVATTIRSVSTDEMQQAASAMQSMSADAS